MKELVLAYVMGMLSILSPCCLVMIPAIAAQARRRAAVFIFLLGASVTFTALGAVAALSGRLLSIVLGPWLFAAAASITLMAGLHQLSIISLRLPFFALGKRHSFISGAVFGGIALGCISPLLASVLAYIAATSSVMEGIAIMSAFSLGFMTPFFIFGFLLTGKMAGSIILRHAETIKAVTGWLLILVSFYLWYILLRGLAG